MLGDSYINTPTSLGDSISFRGFSVFKKNSWDEALNVDNTSISGFASNDIVVELYENKILKGYQIVSNGRYQFNVDVRSGNKSYEVWLYKEDGTIDKKQVSIYGDTNLLGLGEIDYDFQVGEDLDRKGYTPYNTNLYYGVTQNFTMQLGLYNSIFKGNEKQYINISPVFRIGTTSKWSHLIAGDYVQNLSLKSENYQRLELQSSNNTITNTFGFENYHGFHSDEINENYDEKQYWRATFPIMNIQTNIFYEREKNSETTLNINRYGFNMYQSYFRDKLTVSAEINEEHLLQKKMEQNMNH